MVVRTITPVSMIMATTSNPLTGLIKNTEQVTTCSIPKSIEGSALVFCAKLCYLIIVMKQAVGSMVCPMEVHPSLIQVSLTDSITGIEKYSSVKLPAKYSVWDKFTFSMPNIIYVEVTLLSKDSTPMFPLIFVFPVWQTSSSAPSVTLCYTSATPRSCSRWTWFSATTLPAWP
jgi:hypothetical protein